MRKHLYDKAKRSNLHSDWNAYRKMKISINTNLREARNSYYRKLFDSSFSGNR